jgi:hypothetical protein
VGDKTEQNTTSIPTYKQLSDVLNASLGSCGCFTDLGLCSLSGQVVLKTVSRIPPVKNKSTQTILSS